MGLGVVEYYGVVMGDCVIVEQIVFCGKCCYCKIGYCWMCEVYDVYGFQCQVVEGGMVDYMWLLVWVVIYKIFEYILFEDVVVIELLFCVIYVVNCGDIQLDDVVVIVGVGMLGLLMVQVVYFKMLKKLIVIDFFDQCL